MHGFQRSLDRLVFAYRELIVASNRSALVALLHIFLHQLVLPPEVQTFHILHHSVAAEMVLFVMEVV